MFKVLSGEKKRRVISPMTIAASVAAHLLLLGGAVYAAANDKAPEEVVTGEYVLPPLPEPAEPKVEDPPPPPPPADPVEPSQPVPTPGQTLQLDAPTEVPDVIKPQAPSTVPIDPTQYSGIGPVGDVIGPPPAEPTPPTRVTEPAPVRDYVPDESMVEERPVLDRDGLGRTMERYYPSSLRDSRTAGRVVIELIVDENGRVRENSARVVEASHPAFGDAALRAVQRFRFRPAKMGGVSVPVRVTIPINWTVPN